MAKVYEIIDRSNEEMYFTIGLFATLEAAIAEVEKQGVSIIDELGDDEASVEIAEREIGKAEWSGTGKVVWSRRWVRDWDEEDEDLEWKIHPITTERATDVSG